MYLSSKASTAVLLCIFFYLMLVTPFFIYGQNGCEENTDRWNQVEVPVENMDAFTVAGDEIYIGEKQTFLKTSDCGASWDTLQTTDARYKAVQINPVHPDTIYIATGKKLLLSPDGGNSFQNIGTELSLGAEETISQIAVYPKSPNVIYVETNWFMGDRLFMTSNYGKQWTDITPSSSGNIFYDIRVPRTPTSSDTVIYTGISEDTVLVWKAHHSDTSLTEVPLGTNLQKQLHISHLTYPEDRLYISTADSLFYTDNYFDSVTPITALPDSIGGISSSVHVFDASIGNHFYFSSLEGDVFLHEVESESFSAFNENLPVGTSVTTLDVHKGPGLTLYAVTANSNLYTQRYSLGLPIPRSASKPESFSLKQNYPNPFNPTTSIKYFIPEATKVNLTVYNMLGQQVAELVNTRKQAGAYTATFDAGQLSSGVYIYKLQTESFSKSRKMLLLK